MLIIAGYIKPLTGRSSTSSKKKSDVFYEGERIRANRLCITVMERASRNPRNIDLSSSHVHREEAEILGKTELRSRL